MITTALLSFVYLSYLGTSNLISDAQAAEKIMPEEYINPQEERKVISNQTSPLPEGTGQYAQLDSFSPQQDLLPAVIVPYIESTLASELSGQIISIKYKEGQEFKSGSALISFDCEMYEASLAKARAELKAAEAVLKARVRLHKLGAASQLEVTLAEADKSRSDAEMSRATVYVDRCELLAPYDGSVVNVMANEYDTVKEGQPLIRIVAQGQPAVEILIASNRLEDVRKGGIFTITIDETGEEYPIEIKEVVSRIDPVSQLVKLIGSIADDHAASKVIPGMTGVASFITFEEQEKKKKQAESNEGADG